MSLKEWLVIGGGLAAIVWLNWYFLFSDRRKRGANAESNKRSTPE